jgi:hypothetical protein
LDFINIYTVKVNKVAEASSELQSVPVIDRQLFGALLKGVAATTLFW